MDIYPNSFVRLLFVIRSFLLIRIIHVKRMVYTKHALVSFDRLVAGIPTGTIPKKHAVGPMQRQSSFVILTICGQDKTFDCVAQDFRDEVIRVSTLCDKICPNNSATADKRSCIAQKWVEWPEPGPEPGPETKTTLLTPRQRMTVVVLEYFLTSFLAPFFFALRCAGAEIDAERSNTPLPSRSRGKSRTLAGRRIIYWISLPAKWPWSRAYGRWNVSRWFHCRYASSLHA